MRIIMDFDKIVNEYIEREKGVEPSARLQNNIFAEIEGMGAREYKQPVIKNIFRNLAVAASIVIAAILGVAVGNGYNSQSYGGLAVNDTQIEQFVIYFENENE